MRAPRSSAFGLARWWQPALSFDATLPVGSGCRQDQAIPASLFPLALIGQLFGCCRRELLEAIIFAGTVDASLQRVFLGLDLLGLLHAPGRNDVECHMVSFGLLCWKGGVFGVPIAEPWGAVR